MFEEGPHMGVMVRHTHIFWPYSVLPAPVITPIFSFLATQVQVISQDETLLLMYQNWIRIELTDNAF